MTRVDTDAGERRLGARVLTPGTTVGRYVILDRIGAGGMGFVYAAYDPDLDRKVALKLLRGGDGDGSRQSRGARRLVREAQAMAKLHHPNVVTVHDVGTYGGHVFFAMEFLDGRTVKDWLSDDGPSWPEVLEVFLAAGRGLAAAHAIELTHRDFKPENVMIERTGRVLVLDFGLARAERTGAASVGDEGITASSSSLASASITGEGTLDDLTRTGAVVGTPAYMAPEQHLGEAADARSDQFSFCVALYEALFGDRPFRGNTHAALAFNVTSGKVIPPPKGTPVPAVVIGAVLRGLELDPRDRWPSMEALLDVIAKAGQPTPRRRWPVVAGLGAVAVLAGVGLFGGGASDPCASAAAGAEGVWNEARRDALAEAFSAIGLDFAARTWTDVEQRVDAYVAEWGQQREQACLDTRVQHTMSGEVMDLRNVCLDRALAELDARLVVMSEPDVDVALNALESVSELPSLARCGDVAALRAAVPPPEDPAEAERVERIRVSLSDARARELGGRYAEGMELASSAAEEATSIGYCPLEAEAQLQLGRLHRQLGAYETAERSLEDAYFTGTRCRHEAVAIDAANLLTRLVGARLQRFDEGVRWGRYVGAILERDERRNTQAHARLLLNLADLESQRGDGERALELAEQALEIAQTELTANNPQLFTAQHRVGLALAQMGRYEDALAALERALERGEQAFGPEHPRLASVMQAIANAHADRGEYDAAIERFEQALRLREAALGPGHADVASARNDLGTVYYYMGRFDDAQAELERALAIRQEALGSDHSAVGGTWNNLGNLYEEMGDIDRALDAYRRALAVFEISVGKEHRFTAAALNNIGILLDEKGRYEEAIEYYERALAIKRATLGMDHEKNGATLQNIAAAYEMMGRFDDALSYYREAHAVTRAALGDDHPAVAYPLVGLASTFLNLGRAQDAREPLEHALRIRESTEVPEKELAITQFHLARALWDVPDERERARELLARGHATLVHLGEPAASYLAQVDAWTRGRRIRL